MPFSDFISNYYPSAEVWDEMCMQGEIRNHYQIFLKSLEKVSMGGLTKKDELAKKLFMSQGITFTVYNDGEGIEKIFPFDIIPRIITATEWAHIEAGIKQRLKALNMFLKDVYHEQSIIRDKIIPAELIQSCPNFLKEMVGVDTYFRH
jgi:uncharacterized circularly permuted ATP-grasp superfamily protein